MLFPTRLFWAQGRGFAQCDGVYATLTTRPAIPGLQEMTEMDYLPGMSATVREGCNARRELTSDEAAATLKWLVGRTAAAHDAANNETTIAVVAR